MAKLTRAQYLQENLDEHLNSENGDWFVEYRPFDGWYAIPSDPRWFGDEGEFLGVNWQSALRAIKVLY